MSHAKYMFKRRHRERGAWRRQQVGTAGLGLQFHAATSIGRIAVALSLNGPRADVFVPEARHSE